MSQRQEHPPATAAPAGASQSADASVSDAEAVPSIPLSALPWPALLVVPQDGRVTIRQANAAAQATLDIADGGFLSATVAEAMATAARRAVAGRQIVRFRLLLHEESGADTAVRADAGAPARVLREVIASPHPDGMHALISLPPVDPAVLTTALPDSIAAAAAPLTMRPDARIFDALRLQSALEAAEIGVLEMDTVDWQVASANAFAEHLFGAEPGLLNGRAYGSLLMPESLAETRANIRRVSRGEPLLPDFQRHYRRLDGRGFWAQVYASLAIDPATGQQRAICLLFGLTGPDALQRALRNLASRVESLMEVVPVPICVARIIDGKVLAANRSFCRLTDLRQREATVARAADFFTDSAQFARLVSSLAREGELSETETAVVTRSGEARAVVLSMSRIDHGGDPALFIALHDITHLREQDRQIKEREALLRHSARLARLGYAVADSSGRLHTVSDALAVLFGRSPAAILADHADERGRAAMAAPDDRLRIAETLRAAHSTAAPYDLRYRVIGPDGSTRHLREIGEPQSGASLAGGYLVTAQDVTEQVEREAALLTAQQELQTHAEALRRLAADLDRARRAALDAQRDAETANRAKSEFLTQMSHELRTPLNAIIGFADLMRLEVLGDLGSERYRQYCADILLSAQHLLGLIENLLDLSKIESGRLDMREAAMDLGDVLGQAVALLTLKAEKKRLRLDLQSVTLPPIYADRRLLLQVAINILGNAVKFTPQGGRVVVRSGVDQNWVFFEVVDTGPGIPPDMIGQVLQPFVQVASHQTPDEGGSGLGLAIVHRLMTMHGGHVGIDSTVGAGTTVRCLLPRSRLQMTPV